MIKLYVDPWCDNCPEFDADIEKKVAKDNYGQTTNVTIIRCVHHKKCEAIKDYMEEEKEQENES